MRSKLSSFLRTVCLGLIVVGSCLPALRAQNELPSEVAKFGYADEIVVNGKIVSMDDYGYNANPGHIYEAMALKGNRILGLGTNQQIRAMAKPDARMPAGSPESPGRRRCGARRRRE